jgi:hypothetical protein
MTEPITHKALKAVRPLVISVLILVAGALILLFANSVQNPLAVDVSGVAVSDSTKVSVPSAYVQLVASEAAPPTSSFADENGKFLVSINAAPIDRQVTLLVRAPGFRTFTRVVSIPTRQGSSKEPVRLYIGQIQLTAVPPESGTETYTDTMQQTGFSGDGASYGAAYEICSAPPSPGYVVQSTEFKLLGDRACNSWSTCEKTIQTDKQVCYTFRLQGHSECKGRVEIFGIRVPDQCPPSRPTTGVLRTEYVFRARPTPLYVTYKQPVLASKAAEICSSLDRTHFRCIEPLRMTGSYTTHIGSLGEPDQRLDQELSTAIKNAGFAISKNQADSNMPPSRGIPPSYEAWLDADAK